MKVASFKVMFPFMLITPADKDPQAVQEENFVETRDLVLQFLTFSLGLMWYNSRKEKQAIEKWRKDEKPLIIEDHKKNLILIKNKATKFQ